MSPLHHLAATSLLLLLVSALALAAPRDPADVRGHASRAIAARNGPDAPAAVVSPSRPLEKGCWDCSGRGPGRRDAARLADADKNFGNQCHGLECARGLLPSRGVATEDSVAQLGSGGRDRRRWGADWSDGLDAEAGDDGGRVSHAARDGPGSGHDTSFGTDGLVREH